MMCPACNAFAILKYACPACSHSMEDQGRFDAYTMDYAPYRPMDDMKLSNGFYDLQTHRCVHLVYCPRCQRDERVYLDEWDTVTTAQVESAL